MKKAILISLLTAGVLELNAQLITTPATNIPIQINRDLNFLGEVSITANGASILKSINSTNLGVGQYAGNPALPAGENTWVGVYAGNESTGSGNLAFGGGSLRYSSSSTTTALGYYSGANSSGGNNSFLGNSAGRYNTASNSISIGYQSGYSNAGNNSISIGFWAGQNNKGENNISIGFLAGQNSNTEGINNVFMGTYSGQANGDGGANTFIGGGSGSTNTTGSNNTFIGAGARGSNGTITNATAIGYGAIVDASNSLLLGNNSVNVGINTGSPSAKLHIVGGNSIATGVRFENLPSKPGGTTTNYVVIDGSGNLYKTTGASGAKTSPEDVNNQIVNSTFSENWTLKNDFLYNKNKKGIIIGQGISSLPKGYCMYVTDGILTEKVKVALKNTSDWADYVFDKNYERLTLMEVDKFINKYKHLPNIPTSTEMAKSGNDLHKTDVKLLEKIEELTLYMIELNQKYLKISKENKQIKRKLQRINLLK